MQPIQLHLASSAAPAAPPVPQTETLTISLNQQACGVLVLPLGEQGQVLASGCRDLVGSLEKAVHVGTGGFQRVQLIAPRQGSTFYETAQACVVDAARQECGWVLLLTPGCVLHPEIFVRSAGALKQVEGLWGTIVDLAADQKSMNLRVPQLLKAQQLSEILLYHPACGLEAGCFVRTDVLLKVLHSEGPQIVDFTTLSWEVWKQARCAKVPLQLVNLKTPLHAAGAALAQGVARRWAELKKETGLREGSVKLTQIRNQLSGQMQDFARQAQHNVTYFAASRMAPWHGYVDIQIFEGEDFTLFSNNDDLCALSLQWTGQYEPASTFLWQKLARQTNMILDIGAYTGLYSILAARANPSARILGFEPLSRNYARFVMNTQLNQLAGLSPVRAAVGRQSGQAQLSIYSNGDFLTSGASIVKLQSNQPVDVETVPLVSIDQLLEQHRLPVPGLIKIDAEGAELDVLLGMQKTLAHKPDLLLECLAGSRVKEIGELLKAQGYQFYAIAEDRMSVEPLEQLTTSSGSLHDLNRLATTRRPEQLTAILSESAPGTMARVA